MQPLETAAELTSVLQDPDRIAREWKAQGGKVVGTRCLFVPEEIVWAAGMLPYPIYGRPEPVRLADSYFQSCTCEFVRNLFDHALVADRKKPIGVVPVEQKLGIWRFWEGISRYGKEGQEPCRQKIARLSRYHIDLPCPGSG